MINPYSRTIVIYRDSLMILSAVHGEIMNALDRMLIAIEIKTTTINNCNVPSGGAKYKSVTEGYGDVIMC